MLNSRFPKLSTQDLTERLNSVTTLDSATTACQLLGCTPRFLGPAHLEGATLGEVIGGDGTSPARSGRVARRASCSRGGQLHSKRRAL